MKVLFRKGDSFWYYSQLFSIPLPLLIDSNKKCKAESVEAGAEIVIPGHEIVKYEARNEDNAWRIANEKNVSLDAIYLVNQHRDITFLKAGQQINIPKKIEARIVNPKKNYDFKTFQADLKNLCRVYPFLEYSSIGQSVLGKPLYHLRLGRGKKKIHWNGSFHANEWITTSVIMASINDFLLGLTNIRTIRSIPFLPLYEQIHLSVVPMVNPDGVDLVLNGPPSEAPFKENVINLNRGSTDFIGWKANIRGIDLNKHFPANWEFEKNRKEEKAPSPRDYPGESPLTEPEAGAMATLAEKEKFDMLVAVHTQGEEFYWGYEGNEPPESHVIAKEFERVSTYKSVQYVDSHAGYRDWFIQEFKKPGFTLELGKGINPLPLSQFDTIYQKTFGIFLASMYL